MSSNPDPEPDPRSLTKGEAKRKQIVQAIQMFTDQNQKPPSLQDVQDLTGLRSFNTISRHLKALKKDGIIHWEQNSSAIIITENK